MPAQDRARGDQAMATQARGQPAGRGRRRRPGRPSPGVVSGWCGGAPRPRAAARGARRPWWRTSRPDQQDQPEHLLKDQIQQPQRHGGDHARPPWTADHRWSAACTTFWNPTGLGGTPRRPEPSYDDMTIKLRRVIIAARFRSPCPEQATPARNPGRPRRLGRRRNMINECSGNTRASQAPRRTKPGGPDAGLVTGPLHRAADSQSRRRELSRAAASARWRSEHGQGAR